MRDYFLTRLGFHPQGEFTPPGHDAPSWASVMRDGVEIMMLGGDYPEPAQDWAAYIWVDDADALYTDFTTAGADIVCPPADTFYKNREFQVRLPDGRLLAFAQSLV
jgi:uncharacterized glyoxalase superfamily protein PhnB